MDKLEILKEIKHANLDTYESFFKRATRFGIDLGNGHPPLFQLT